MNPNQKLYIIVRGDIPPGYQLAQSCHAAFRFAAEHPGETATWLDVSEYICCLSVPTELELSSYIEVAEATGIPHSVFREPDIGDQITAVALAPTERARVLCSKLSLALRSL